MEIDKQLVFRFRFPFLGTEALFNVVANSQEEAADKILDWMRNTITELSMAFPKVSQGPGIPNETTVANAMADLRTSTRIDTLIEDLSKWLAKGASAPDTVKEWLKMDYNPETFPAIIEGLEKLKTMYETGKIKKAGRP